MSERDPAVPGSPPAPEARTAKLDWADLPSAPAAGAAAPARSPVPATAFTAGRFIGAIFTCWGRNALRFIGVALAGAIPVAAFAYFAFRSMAAPSADPAAPFVGALDVWSRTLPTMGVGMLLAPIVNGAIVRGAVQHLRGAPVEIGDMLSTALRRYLPLLAIMVLVPLMFLATGCTVVVPAILGAGWAAAVAAALLEGHGPVTALGRSWTLSRGLRWQILAGFLVVMLASWAVLGPLQMVLGLVLGSTGAAVAYGDRMAVIQSVTQLASAATTSLLAVSFGVVYHQLRVATEGTDATQLGQVFE